MPPSDDTPNLLGNNSIDSFFNENWGKRPWIGRQALTDRVDCVDHGDLFRLATRKDVPSRIVERDSADGSWNARRGPFRSTTFKKVPERDWTLLVQECDRHLPNCAELLNRARFLPNWRIDDAMVSLATPGGGVGPHVDRYDVFLIQLSGRREWRFGDAPAPTDDTADAAVSATADLPNREILEPGDILYLPARVAHDGVALDTCVTLSIGFRTPNGRDFAQQYFLDLPEITFTRSDRPDYAVRRSPRLGELTNNDVDWLRAGMQTQLESPRFVEWCGRYVTRPLRVEVARAGQALGSIQDVWDHLEGRGTIRRLANCYFAWSRIEQGELLLFIGGELYRLAPEQIDACQRLCEAHPLTLEELREPLSSSPEFAGALCDAVMRGFLVMESAQEN